MRQNKLNFLLILTMLLSFALACSQEKTGTHERALYRVLRSLAGKGFRLTRIIPTKSPYSIVEAVKA